MEEGLGRPVPRACATVTTPELEPTGRKTSALELTASGASPPCASLPSWAPLTPATQHPPPVFPPAPWVCGRMTAGPSLLRRVLWWEKGARRDPVGRQLRFQGPGHLLPTGWLGKAAVRRQARPQCRLLPDAPLGPGRRGCRPETCLGKDVHVWCLFANCPPHPSPSHKTQERTLLQKECLT